jgi:ketosteroid isomerase-like protein
MWEVCSRATIVANGIVETLKGVGDLQPVVTSIWSAASLKRTTVMLARAHVEKVIRVCTEEADFEAFRAYAAPDFVYEFIGSQPFAGEWRGVDAVKRQFAAIQEHFTSKFGFTATEIHVDSEKRTAAVRLHSHPLTDKGGGAWRQHCAWFLYFDENDKVARIVQYDDTKLVNDMILRVETAKMNELRHA